MKWNTIQKLSVKGKRVMLRADLNVPLSYDAIINDFRLQAIRPTLDYLLEQGAKIILATHIGHPELLIDHGTCPQEALAKVNVSHHPELSTKRLLPWFKEHGYAIEREKDLHIAQRKSMIDPETILLLENLRFFHGETEHNVQFADMLAELADIYINDAFGLIHRNDTSITLLAEQFAPEDRGIGLLMEKEMHELSQLRTNPTQPYLMILGGKKIKDKIALLEHALQQPHHPTTIILGGAIAQTFLVAQGHRLGMSLVDPSALDLAQRILSKAKAANITLELPKDLMIELSNGTVQDYPITNIPRQGTAIDIGPASIKRYTQLIEQAETIFMNGTMGKYEQTSGSVGTQSIFSACAKSKAHTVVGGGDAVAALYAYGLADSIDYISTGGGATLAFLSARNPDKLPGLICL